MLGFQLEIEVPIYRTAQPQECAPTAYEDLLCDPTVVDGQDEAFICHSSGSTGIPKLFSTRHATIPAELKHIRPMFGHTIDDWIASAPYNVAGLRVAVSRSSLLWLHSASGRAFVVILTLSNWPKPFPLSFQSDRIHRYTPFRRRMQRASSITIKLHSQPRALQSSSLKPSQSPSG